MSKRTFLFVLGGLVVANLAFVAVQHSYARRNGAFEQLDLIVDAYHEVVSQYVEEQDPNAVAEAAVRGMLKSLNDPYTTYYSKEEMEGFNKNVRGTFSGIGAEVDIDLERQRLRIVSPLEDSPAWKAGVIAGDIVMEINGKTTKGMNINECVKALVGPVGTEVTIKVVHRSGKEEVITIKRAKINIQTVRGWRRDENNHWDYMLDKENKIGYVRLTQFTDQTVVALNKVIDDFEKNKAKAVIIDLRFNPGGLLGAVVDISKRFLGSNERIVSTKGRNVPETISWGDDKQTFPDIPIVVLINESSASASEILAGALKDNNRAKLIGARTFGKGSVQHVKRLEGQGALKLTSAYYYLPNGQNIHKRKGKKTWGVDPHEGFYVPLSGQQIEDMIKIRRENAVNDSDQFKNFIATPESINKTFKDPQLAAGLKAILGKIKTDKWPVVGQSGAQALAQKGKIESLSRRRDALVELLGEIDKELVELRGPKQDASKKKGDDKKGPEAKVDAPKDKAAPAAPAPKP